MTVVQILLIILWSVVGLFTIALLLVTYLLGRHSIKDNINYGAVFVKTGNHVGKPIKAKLGEVTKTGCYYLYDNKAVFIPASYNEYFYSNFRMIFVSHLGQLIASPFSEDKPITKSAEQTLIYELVTSHIGADGMRALKGKGIKGIFAIIAIIVVVALVAVFGVYQYQKTQHQKALNQQTPVTQQAPETPKYDIIEVE